jgi:hypothetical protein
MKMPPNLLPPLLVINVQTRDVFRFVRNTGSHVYLERIKCYVGGIGVYKASDRYVCRLDFLRFAMLYTPMDEAMERQTLWEH